MTMARDTARPTLVRQGPREPDAAPYEAIRDSLAEIHPGLHRTCPAALDLAANLHGVLHSHLTGIASQVAGAASPAHCREQLRGERNLPVVQLAFLAVQPMAEPRAAIAAFGAALLREVGYRATPESGGDVVLGAALVTLIQHSGATLAVVQSAREDGRIDNDERPKVVLALETLQRQVADLLEAVRQTGERA